MKPTMSMFATYADYMAACSSDKSAVVAHYAAEEAKAAEEAQQAKDAERWRHLMSMWIFDADDLLSDCCRIEDFEQAIDEQIAAAKEQ